MIPARKKNSEKRQAGTRRTRKHSSWLSQAKRRLIVCVVASLFFILGGVIWHVFFPPTVTFDESGLVRKSEIIFEEPNPPVHELPRPPAVETRLPQIAIIIDDMGYHEKVGEELLALPLQLTFSFLPFAPFTGKQEIEAHASGHTVLLHLPMQSQKSEWDPGPGALFLGETEERQQEIFEADLAWVPHAVGVNNHMGSLYTENEQPMRSLLAMIKGRGLFFVDSVTSPQTVGSQLALEMGVKTARRQIFLDNIHTEEKIRQQLEKLVELAKKEGKAIGICHPHPETLQALTASVPLLTAEVRLVGVQELLQDKE
jgi:uncharacterized protein